MFFSSAEIIEKMRNVSLSKKHGADDDDDDRDKDSTTRRQRKRLKNNRFNKQKNNFARTHAFLYITLEFLHDHDVEMPNLVFYEERKQATTKGYFAFWTWIWSLGIQIQEGSCTFDKVS